MLGGGEECRKQRLCGGYCLDNRVADDAFYFEEILKEEEEHTSVVGQTGESRSGR